MTQVFAHDLDHHEDQWSKKNAEAIAGYSLLRRASRSLEKLSSSTVSSIPRSSSRSSSRRSFTERLSLRKGQHHLVGEDEFQVNVGDVLETLEVATICKSFGERLDLSDLSELPRGVTGVVECLGECSRRVRISTGSGVCGWINIKGMDNTPVVAKISIRPEDEFEPGGIHHVMTQALIMRESEELDSDVLGRIEPGKMLRILEIGSMNKRRAKVQADIGVGWVSVQLHDGQALIGMLHQEEVSQDTMEMITAVQQRNLSSVKEKLERTGRKSLFGHANRCGVNSVDCRGRTALMHASISGNVDIVEYLLEFGSIDVNRADDMHRTALHHCVRLSTQAETSTAVACVNALCQKNAKIEAIDNKGFTPLMLAAKSGNADAIMTLLQSRADAGARNCNGQTPLDIALEAGHGEDVLAKLHGSPQSRKSRRSLAASILVHSSQARPEEDLPSFKSEVSLEDGGTDIQSTSLAGELEEPLLAVTASLEPREFVEGKPGMDEASQRSRIKPKVRVSKKKPKARASVAPCQPQDAACESEALRCFLHAAEKDSLEPALAKEALAED